MNLFTLLNNRSKPITIGIIGAGKFATMFFAQALKIPSIHIVGIVDLYPEKAKSNIVDTALATKYIFTSPKKAKKMIENGIAKIQSECCEENFTYKKDIDQIKNTLDLLNYLLSLVDDKAIHEYNFEL